jgi:hypothetical protein
VQDAVGREAMDLVYRHDGSTLFKRESRLAECWRDLHTVAQTVTLAPEWYPIGGRVYLGIDPGPAPALAATTTSSVGNPPESDGSSGLNNRHSASSWAFHPLERCRLSTAHTHSRP